MLRTTLVCCRILRCEVLNAVPSREFWIFSVWGTVFVRNGQETCVLQCKYQICGFITVICTELTDVLVGWFIAVINCSFDVFITAFNDPVELPIDGDCGSNIILNKTEDVGFLLLDKSNLKEPDCTPLEGLRGGAVGSGTALQAGRLRVRFRWGSLRFFIGSTVRAT